MTTPAFPATVHRDSLALALNCHPRSVCRIVGRPFNKSSTRISFRALAKAIGCDPHWLLRVLRKEDRAISLTEAASVLGMNERRLMTLAKRLQLYWPAAVLGRAWRYSERDLVKLVAPPKDKWTPADVGNLIRGRIEIGIADGDAETKGPIVCHPGQP